MAIDKKLQIFDDEGNPVDYDILASDVKFNDGKDLPTKLDEMEDEIGEGGYTPPQGGIPKTDLAPSVQQTLDDVDNKVDKETGKGLSTNDYTTAEKAKLQNLPTADQLTTQLGGKANDNAVVKSISVNNVAQQKDGNGNVNLQVQAGEQVSVIQPDPADGTFIIHVGETDYTINLNHTHENMVKLEIVDEEPSNPALDTIYAQVDDAADPTEIQSLWIAGLEFVGGGAAPGTPAITKPSGTTLNIGNNEGSGVSKAIEIKANPHITGDLTVGLAANSDLSFDTTNLPSGVTYNSGAGTLTIEQLTAIQGVNITIVYSGSGAAEIDGGLVITGGGASPKSVKVVVTATVLLSAIRLTGTQWLKTDYKPNANTEFELECKFTAHSNSPTGSISTKYFMTCQHESNDRFNFGVGGNVYPNPYYVVFSNNTKNDLEAAVIGNTKFFLDHSILKYEKYSGKMRGMFRDVEVILRLKSTPMQSDWAIGYAYYNDTIFSDFYLTIYGLKITENGSVVRNYKPYMYNGVPGLYCDVTDTFISSETAVAVEYDEVE